MANLLTRTSIVTAVLVMAGVGVESAGPAATPNPEIRRAVRQVTVPAGTVLRLRVSRGFGSDISRVEDQVSATLAQARRRRRPHDSERGESCVGIRRTSHTARQGEGTRPCCREVYPDYACRPRRALCHANAVVGRGSAGNQEAGRDEDRIAGGRWRDFGGIVGGKKGAGVGALAGGGQAPRSCSRPEARRCGLAAAPCCLCV